MESPFERRAASDHPEQEERAKKEGGGQLPPSVRALSYLSADGRRFNFLFVAVGSILDDGTVGLEDIPKSFHHMALHKYRFAQ